MSCSPAVEADQEGKDDSRNDQQEPKEDAYKDGAEFSLLKVYSYRWEKYAE